MTDLDQTKAGLRAELRARRLVLKAAHPDAALDAARAFVEARLGRFEAAAIYHPRGGELDPYPLAALLERIGCRIALPVAVAKDQPLVFRLPSETGPLPVDAAGIPAPPPEAEAVRPDLVIVPLLGFDRRGYRLGQGGGYYDRTLAALRQDRPVLAIGLGYAGQELPRVPAGPFDQRLDGVVTEAGYRPAETD